MYRGAFAATLGLGDVGLPVASTDLRRALLEVTYFTGLGALIVFLGGAAVARLAVRHARDVMVSEPAAVAEPAVPAGEPVRTDRTAVEPEPEPRRRLGGGLFHRRHHHAGV